MSALLYEVVLIKLLGTFEAVIGRLLSEITGWMVGPFLTRVPVGPALREFILPRGRGGAGVIAAVCLFCVWLRSANIWRRVSLLWRRASQSS